MQLVTEKEVVSSRPPFLDKEKYFELARERGLISPDGDFFLLGANVFLSPCPHVLGWGSYYFISEEAAQNFYDLFYANARYQVVLCRKIKVL